MNRSESAKKAAATRRRRAAARKAAAVRKHRAAGRKAAATKRRRAAANDGVDQEAPVRRYEAAASREARADRFVWQQGDVVFRE